MGHLGRSRQNMIWTGLLSWLRQNMIWMGHLTRLRDMIWIGHLSWYDNYRFLFRDVICLGKLILFKGSVYNNNFFIRFGFICPRKGFLARNEEQKSTSQIFKINYPSI